MNNEKLILESCELILQVGIENQPTAKERERAVDLRNRIKEALNPKEDVPYEKSIEVCGKCDNPKKEHYYHEDSGFYYCGARSGERFLVR